MVMIYPAVDLIFKVISILIFSRVILSWVPHDRFHPLIKLVYQMTDPILKPLQGMIQFPGGLDLSPIIAIFLLNFLKRAVISLIFGM